MRIERNKYVRDLELRMGNGMAKVITGVRRCGKSYLLFNLFGDFLRSRGVDGAHIVGIALDDEDNEELRDPQGSLRPLEGVNAARRWYLLRLSRLFKLAS